LLIVRDMMVRGFSIFKQFQGSGERIATNILADRLMKLRRAGIIIAERDTEDARAIHYRLTQKGIDLAPLLLELLIWGSQHAKSDGRCAAISYMERNREAVLAEVRRRWRERDSRPLQANGRWAFESAKS
jgi:DNA-binding HxlR family transcriptional regulator